MQFAPALTALYFGGVIFALLFGTKKGTLIYLVGLAIAAFVAMSQSSNMAMLMGYSLAFGWPVLLAVVAFGAFSAKLLAAKQYWIIAVPIAIYAFADHWSSTKENLEAGELQTVTDFVEKEPRLQILNGGRIKASLVTRTTFNEKSRGRYEFNISGVTAKTPIYVTVNVDRTNATAKLDLGCITKVYLGHRDTRSPCQSEIELPLLDASSQSQQKILANAVQEINQCNWVGFNPIGQKIEIWAIEAPQKELPGLGFQIDAQEDEAVLMNVEINKPGKRIALLLVGYNKPIIWDISRSKDTTIAAILVSGSHRSAVSGIDAKTPVIVTSAQNPKTCTDFYLNADPDFRDRTDEKSKLLFGRKPDKFFQGSEKTTVLGLEVGDKSKLIRNTENSPLHHRAPNTPATGEAGLREAMSKGLIRSMTKSDIAAWETEANKFHLTGTNLKADQSRRPDINRGYVVLQPFTIPANLAGAHSIDFILPKEIEVPIGPPTHSTIFDYRTMTSCSPTKCRNSH